MCPIQGTGWRFMSLRRVAGLVAGSVLAFLVADLAAADGNSPPIPCEAVDSVGTATMSADGTITLHVHALWPQPIAETELIYAPGNPHYDTIKRHLGGLAPGQSKPVPPLCGTNSEP
jgi:hypothetical protein